MPWIGYEIREATRKGSHVRKHVRRLAYTGEIRFGRLQRHWQGEIYQTNEEEQSDLLSLFC